ncbi:hypothetical protein ACFFIX_04395 [Metabacillus herbersteinensis]|uniref:Uncharacterized protein n=1 Tax=Metabacillus herbersteinensis TaxID=283816 RepID=A0ABV6GAU5_9BACI
MKVDESILTDEEVVLVQKLKNEMFSALTLDHMHFYKKELNQIISQAKRRNHFIHTHTQVN